MNFLGHAYLSFTVPEILAGNMVSDFVKGNAQYNFSEGIQKGMMLHRKIDEFTDNHPATTSAKQIFRPVYRLYSGPMMDIIYDHYLATDEAIFTPASLQEFTRNTYTTLSAFTTQLPSRFVQVLTYMEAEDWLYNYRFPEGIQRSLRGLHRRSMYMPESSMAYQLFLEHYEQLRQYYQAFIEDVKQFSKICLAQLIS